jgi:putative transposase
MRDVAIARPFMTLAIVLLWDHLHCVWSLPSGDEDFSSRWYDIKAQFTQRWLEQGGHEMHVTPAQKARGHRGIWQKRFWEHLIQDEGSLARRCDYIHYNPVKHGYVTKPWDWSWSSFRRFVEAGEYDPDWGRSVPQNLIGIDWE